MPRILIVEDEPDIALALEDDLTREGYEVEVVARRRRRPARRGREPGFDLILLDVMLPGRTASRSAASCAAPASRTPIILLTARTQEAEKVLGLELGADDYVTKPFSPRELRARIKAVLRRTSPERRRRSSVSATSKWTSRAARCAGTGSPSTSRALEFKLLTAFIRSRGRAAHREQLLDAVWGRDIARHRPRRRHHIVNLRRKIEPRSGRAALSGERPRHGISIRWLKASSDLHGPVDRALAVVRQSGVRRRI